MSAKAMIESYDFLGFVDYVKTKDNSTPEYLAKVLEFQHVLYLGHLEGEISPKMYEGWTKIIETLIRLAQIASRTARLKQP